MARRKRVRWDRVILVIVVALALIFCIFKGVSFIIDKVTSANDKKDSQVTEEETVEYLATVVVDPGHGSVDDGAVNGDLYEKNIVLQVGKYVAEELESKNIKAVLTRTDDTRLKTDRIEDLSARAQMSAQVNADYFVSIHVNSFEDSNDVSGFEVYYRNEESQSLANMISTQLEELNLSKNRGVLDGSTLVVLKENTVPSALVELGYINGPDYEYLNDDQKLQQLAKAIATGIENKVKAE